MTVTVQEYLMISMKQLCKEAVHYNIAFLKLVLHSYTLFLLDTKTNSFKKGDHLLIGEPAKE